MKSKKIQGKLALTKETIVNLSNADMQHQRGGTATNPKLCSYETYCRTECMLSICIVCF